MAREYWISRSPTKHGRIGPLSTKLNRIGEPSSAMGRHEQRLGDRSILARNVQLEPGLIVIHDRKPWRVLEVAERPIDLWGERYDQAFDEAVQRWERYPHGDRPERATWYQRPITIILVPDGDPKATPTHLIGPASHDWPVLPEHYAVCVSCGELPPCPEELADREVQAQMVRTEVLMEIPPGHCLGCGEAITSRMKAERFPGPNLWRPDLGDGSAVFHARQECSGFADRYREQWQAKGNAESQPGLFDATGGEA